MRGELVVQAGRLASGEVPPVPLPGGLLRVWCPWGACVRPERRDPRVQGRTGAVARMQVCSAWMAFCAVCCMNVWSKG